MYQSAMFQVFDPPVPPVKVVSWPLFEIAERWLDQVDIGVNKHGLEV
jgi:hypothetical protein